MDVHRSTHPPAAASSRSTLALLLASSRTVQAHLSIAQPGLGALLASGRIPSARIIGLGLIASWTGLHSVFALNDLLDRGLDRRRFDHLKGFTGLDIDAAIARHPMARGAVSVRALTCWVAANALAACVAAWLLHPVTVAIFFASVGLEVLYCRMATRAPLKFLVTGVMVALGASAGWFAVTRRIDATFVAFAAWMAAWEIGGRNIVNDWSDVEEDRHLGIRTVPLVYGARAAGGLVLGFLIAAAILGVVVTEAAGLPVWTTAAAGAAGAWLLVAPGARLWARRSSEAAHSSFNRASFYPPLVLGIVGLAMVLDPIRG